MMGIKSSDGLQEKVESLRKQSADLGLQAQLELLEIPAWKDSERASPNGFLRSSLFAVTNKSTPRKMFKREKIASLNGVEIYYTGIGLTQDHLSVWEAIMHIARSQNLENLCITSLYEILKLLGKTDSGGNRSTLKDLLAELRATDVVIRQGRYGYSGSLLGKSKWDELKDKWEIILDPEIVALYQPNEYTRMAFSTRAALRRYPMAQWLYGFYSTHKNPLPMKVETIRGLSGARTKNLSDFTKKVLIPNLVRVQNLCRERGETFDFEVKERFLHVVRQAPKIE